MPASRRRHILVLESRPMRRKILQDVLSKDFNVTLTSSVADAAVELQKASHRLDLVVSALQVQTGESVYDLLREANRRSVPLIYCCLFPSHLTMTLQDSMLTAAKLLGAREVLLQEKLDPDALLGLVASILGGKQPTLDE